MNDLKGANITKLINGSNQLKLQARLNVAKYSKKPNVSKALFEYIFYHENSVREAMDLAAQVSQQAIITLRGMAE